jgi:two-component system response regulator EvgA
MSDHYALLVDSNAEYADEMETILSGAGIELVVAATPAQALQLLKTFTPRAVLLDMDRPPRESMRLLSDIRSKAVDPPILWVTDHLTQAGINRVRDSGAQGIMVRAADTVEKVCAVRAMLSGDTYFPIVHTHPATPGAKAIAESERIIRLLHQYAR